jgi:hypothetical protein
VLQAAGVGEMKGGVGNFLKIFRYFGEEILGLKRFGG